MLTAATLGMALYALYSIVLALFDLVFRSQVAAWADLTVVFFGLLLLVSAAFVRVMMPGGLALALGALFGLQALSVHADSHTPIGLTLLPQLVRGGIALALVLLALFGAHEQKRKPSSDAEDAVRR